ncbi:MAG: NUMOD3 motif (2 copies) [bacterium ADurb.Bin363]|nr:MAG: NUMOD3 motif (2 copies) [bacterium ADurb.Bin363]
MDFEIEDEIIKEKDNRKTGIFAIRNLVTGKIYIGQASDWRKVRSSYFSSLREGSFTNKDLQADFNCFGEELFEIEVVEYCSVDVLGERKRHYVDFYVSINQELYNWDNQKMSLFLKGHVTTEETRRKIGNANKGNHHTEETRRKISKIHKGSKLSKEHRDKISEKIKGMRKTEETRRKMSDSRKGIVLSQETRRKMSEARRRGLKKGAGK